MQQFFTTTLVGKYIKYLLSYTPIPLYPLIEHKQYMVKGSIYLYKNKLLKCTKSGMFNGLTQFGELFLRLTASDNLYPRDEKEYPEYLTLLYRRSVWIGNKEIKQKALPLCVTESLVDITDRDFAKYEIINNYTFGEDSPGMTQTFISNSSYYDSNTHKFLGEYLRLLNNYYNINLMSLYNCYNCISTDNITINPNATDGQYVTDNISLTTKVLLVPIKFNKTYTIAMDCSEPILLKAVVYRGGSLVKLYDVHTKISFLSNAIGDKPIKINNSSFNKPFYFNVKHEYDSTNDCLDTDMKLQNVHRFCNDLYLAIQVPTKYNSTVTVLEGQYNNEMHSIVSDIKITESEDMQMFDNALPSVPSLLHINDGNQHPFSDKLISYLLQNTIDTREIIKENISSIQSLINYNPTYAGMWDNKLRYLLYHKYRNIKRTDINLTDMLGYVDADVEDALRKGYMS